MKWLTLDERVRLSARAVKRAGEMPVLATANLSPSLSFHREEMRMITDTGVSGIVLVPPPGLGEHQDRLRDYFADLASKSPVPVFLYEWPLIAPYRISERVFAELTRETNVVGIKDTTCTLEGIQAKIEAAPDALVYQANTPYLLQAVESGAKDVMAVTSAAACDLVVHFWDYIARNERALAAEVHRELVFLDAILRFGYPATGKWLTMQRGIPMKPYCRWPVNLTDESAEALKAWNQSHRK